MLILKRLTSPLGGLAALFALWLPWVHLECSSTQVKPNLWQLADQQTELYLLAAMALILVLAAAGMVMTAKGAWTLGTALAACLGIAGWIYLWIRKDDIGRQQATVEGLGGALGVWMQELIVTPETGFYLYLAGMLLGLLGAVLYLWLPGQTPASEA